jgi:hypothetical protein
LTGVDADLMRHDVDAFVRLIACFLARVSFGFSRFKPLSSAKHCLAPPTPIWTSENECDCALA